MLAGVEGRAGGPCFGPCRPPRACGGRRDQKRSRALRKLSAPCLRGSKDQVCWLRQSAKVSLVHAGVEGARLCEAEGRHSPPRACGGRRHPARANRRRLVSAPCLRGSKGCSLLMVVDEVVRPVLAGVEGTPGVDGQLWDCPPRACGGRREKAAIWHRPVTSAPCMRGAKGSWATVGSVPDVRPVLAGVEGFLPELWRCDECPPRACGGRRCSLRPQGQMVTASPRTRGGESCNGDNVLDGCEQHVMHLAQGLHLRESLFFCLDARNWNTFNRYGINWRRRR